MRKTAPGRSGGLPGILFAAILILFAGGAVAAETASSAGFKWKDGAEVYAKVCGYCHEGGKVGPQLLGRSLPPVYIQQVVRNGNRAMPAFRSAEIDDDALAKVADFIFRQKAPQ